MIDEDRGVLALLDDVAAALIGAGYESPYASTPFLRLRCIRACERLEALGACSRRGRAPQGVQIQTAVMAALIVLLMLEPNTGTGPGPIEDARRALHAVLGELT